MNRKTYGGARRIGLAAVGLLATLSAAAAQTAPAELWPSQVPAPAESGTLDVREAKLTAAAATLPATLRPACEFEAAFLRILAAVSVDEWLPRMQSLATTTANDPVNVGVRDVARAWVARAEMERIVTVLDQYYGEHARYPATFAEVEKKLPSDLRTDPWREPWVYRTHALKDDGGGTPQPYTFGPGRYPDLARLRDAVGGRQPLAVPPWKVTLHEANDARALEFRLNGVSGGVVTAGGTIGGNTLLYMGDHWALLATVDQLFTVSF